MMTVLIIAGSAFGLWLLAAAYLFLVQRRKMYPADRTPLDPTLVPGRAPRVVQTTSADGVATTHWYWSAARPGAATLVVFHGNGGHLAHRVEKLWPLLLAGHGVLFCGYRGYGGNAGRPHEPGLLADARGALAWLAQQKEGGQGVTAPVLYGESLGTAVAVALAAEGRGSALVLEGPFDQAATVAAALYPWLPVRRLIRDRWDSMARIGQVRQPLLWLHGTDDFVTPLPLGQRLFDAAPGPKRGVIVEGGGHVEFLERPAVMAELLAFLADPARDVARQTRRAAFA